MTTHAERLSREADPAFINSEEYKHAYDIVRSWLTYLRTAPPGSEPLVHHFVLNDPSEPERDALHEALAHIIGVSTPRPSSAREGMQKRRLLYGDKDGRILRQVVYPAAETHQDYEQDGRVIKGLPEDAVWVVYSIERADVESPNCHILRGLVAEPGQQEA